MMLPWLLWSKVSKAATGDDAYRRVARPPYLAENTHILRYFLFRAQLDQPTYIVN